MCVYDGLVAVPCTVACAMGCLDSVVVHLLVPMGSVCSPAHGVVMDTRWDMHARLVGCLSWAHANAIGVCRGLSHGLVGMLCGHGWLPLSLTIGAL